MGEILKDKPQDAIDYFNRTMPDVKNDSVRRVIRLQLAELYGKTNQPDKALEQIRELMILAPAGAGVPRTRCTSACAAGEDGSRPVLRLTRCDPETLRLAGSAPGGLGCPALKLPALLSTRCTPPRALSWRA